jgi:hypothetical protein
MEPSKEHCLREQKIFRCSDKIEHNRSRELCDILCSEELEAIIGGSQVCCAQIYRSHYEFHGRKLSSLTITHARIRFLGATDSGKGDCDCSMSCDGRRGKKVETSAL